MPQTRSSLPCTRIDRPIINIIKRYISESFQTCLYHKSVYLPRAHRMLLFVGSARFVIYIEYNGKNYFKIFIYVQYVYYVHISVRVESISRKTCWNGQGNDYIMYLPFHCQSVTLWGKNRNYRMVTILIELVTFSQINHTLTGHHTWWVENSSIFIIFFLFFF